MHQHSRLLLIEDDLKLAAVISEFLTSQQIHVCHASSAQAALQQQKPFDLIISDIMLPDANGIELLQQLRKKWPCPILFLTALTTEQEQINGLEAGAADYLCKPVEPMLLLARLRSALRAAGSSKLSGKMTIGDFLLDKRCYQAYIGSESLQLTALEFDILWLLAAKAGQVVSREQLFLDIVGREYDGLDRAIDLKISRLRRKLQQQPQHGLNIITLRGQGYIFHYQPVQSTMGPAS